ncbi:hypothetical protein LOCC1_G008404 [Lachnellula occidentalis]|uniref:DUF7053 domain-containing protein n=1 Tax=Lachnellula occidentalis TaxID=215460 RepID=A0A8H8UBR0_9HELO|nr:hypothetical protein LOCC1_G008404 [Lachnellula occidentalis]
MSKKTSFTTITPLPAGVSRETALETLHDHLEMIDLNPAHTERRPIASPAEATPEEYHCVWYSITDKISYFPGYKGNISFKACFHDLALGVQIHVYAPMGLDIKEKWSVGGNTADEPIQPAEIGIGAPVSGLYLREDVEIRCNFMLTRFVRKQLKDALRTLVARLMVKAQLQEATETNRRLTYQSFSPHPSHASFSPRPSHASFSPPPSHASFSPPNSPPMDSRPMMLRPNAPPLGTPPLSPPQTGKFPPAEYAPQPLACPPTWSEQRSQVSYKSERESYQNEMYDEKPTYSTHPVYNEMDANQKPKPMSPVELP